MSISDIVTSIEPFSNYTNHNGKDFINDEYISIWNGDKKKINRDSIYCSMIYHNNKKFINSNNVIFIPYINESDIKLSEFLSVCTTKKTETIIIDTNNYVNNYIGGDVDSQNKAIMYANSKNIGVVIYICSDWSGNSGNEISTTNLGYKRLYGKVFVLANPSSRIFRNNKSLSIDMFATIEQMNKLIKIDKTIFTENFNFDIIGKISRHDFINWISVENYINKYNVNIKRNLYGIVNTVDDINKLLIKSRYNIVLGDEDIGILNCGVEGSGKSYLGEQISKVKGVVTIRNFNIQNIKDIKRYNKLWSYDETSIYLFFFDEAEKILKDNISTLSKFKEITGNLETFPGNILFYATSNHHISEFDKSLYRTGRLKFIQWGYLTKNDILNDDIQSDKNIWLKMIESNVNIRYVDYKVKRLKFINEINIKTQNLYDLGVDINKYNFIENDTNNRMNISKYNILSKFKLDMIPNMVQLEYLTLRYYINNESNNNLAWFMYEKDIGNINIFKLPFYVFIMKSI